MIAWTVVAIALFAAAAVPSPELSAYLQRVTFADLPGWPEDQHGEALAAFRRSCRKMMEDDVAFSHSAESGGLRTDWTEVCQDAQKTASPRHFFESRFIPFRVHDAQRPAGLFTGYFEPEVDGSLSRRPDFEVPLYGRPSDLIAFSETQRQETGLAYGRIVDGRPNPYFTRKQIEQGALEGRGLEIAWLRDWADAYFIHIQGSGRVRLEDGSVLRLSYAAKSGLPYTGIAAKLVERGAFTYAEMSMQATRAWISQNGEAARDLMWENQSFVFFRHVELEDPNLGAIGAQHVQLTPKRSLAVDRSVWMFGIPVWLDTMAPAGSDEVPELFRHLTIAQDTGSAIRGFSRGDVFWGFGDEAGRVAGHMKSPGTMYVLLPAPVAARLGLAQ